MKNVRDLLVIAMAVTLLSGCNMVRMTGSPTGNVGRQLLDLHEAHEKELISDDEYERLKSQLLKSTLDDEEYRSN